MDTSVASPHERHDRTADARRAAAPPARACRGEKAPGAHGSVAVRDLVEADAVGLDVQRRANVLRELHAGLLIDRREQRVGLLGLAGGRVEADADEPRVVAVDERDRPR